MASFKSRRAICPTTGKESALIACSSSCRTRQAWPDQLATPGDQHLNPPGDRGETRRAPTGLSMASSANDDYPSRAGGGAQTSTPSLMTPPRIKAAIEQEVVHDRPWPTMLASPHSGSLAAGTSSTGVR